MSDRRPQGPLATANGPAAHGEWPFVAREHELRLVRGLLRSDRGVLLAGAAGVGKSRLALECLAQLAKAGLATARVTASRAAAGIPFGALAPLLPATEDGAGASVDRAGLLRRSAAALVERAAGRRLVLLVDDAHLLDDASATLIHQVVDTDAALVLATVRTGDPLPDPLLSLWKDGLVERLELAGLDDSAVETVLNAALVGAVDPAASAELGAHSGGNLLFLRELTTGALRDGLLRDEGGVWRLVGALSPSPRLTELVEARLRGLTDAERALLEAVSVGEPLGPAELAALAPPAVAESLERRGLLTGRIDGLRLQLRPAHPLYGDVLRATMPTLRRRSIARALAEAVEATGARRREDALRVATWRLDGGGPANAATMLAAATTARWRYDFALAERLTAAALAAGAGLGATLLAAQLAGLQGRHLEAKTRLDALARDTDDDTVRGQVAVIQLEWLVAHPGDIEGALAAAAPTEAATPDPAIRDEIAARRAALVLAVDGPAAGLRVAEPLLAGATGRALAWACIPACYCYARQGRIEAALTAGARGHAAALATPEMDWYPWTHLFYQAEALTHAGRLHEAEALSRAQYYQGVRERSLEQQAFFAFQLAKSVGMRGDVNAAVRHGREAVALYRQLGRDRMVHFCLVYLAHAYALGRRTAEAVEAEQALDAGGRDVRYFLGVDPAEAHGWVAVAAGDLPRARGVFETAATDGTRIGDLAGAASALHSLARIGRAPEVAAPLGDLARRLEGDLAPARAAHARYLAADDADGLAATSAAFAALGAALLAAEAAADAGTAWRRAGQARRAAAAEREAIKLLAHAPGANTPALQALGNRARLTPAEWETAQFAASGRSNRDIAEALSVSVRTVETRLQHVYEKLGVSGRADLAAGLSGTTEAGA
jgi:DNA-binding CsgD family transcriptional regulator